MTKEKPINKPAYDRWHKRLLSPSVIHSIPAAMAIECECLLRAYHGGPFRLAWAMLRKAVGDTIRSHCYACVAHICDLAGWTQLRPVPGTEIKIRHAASCDKLNCEDADCHYRDIPKWYQRLTGMRP